MLYLITHGKRRMTRKSLKKILNLFPDIKDIVLTGTPFKDPREATHFIRFFQRNERECWVETDCVLNDYGLEVCARFGAHFIIIWYGFDEDKLTGCYPLIRAQYVAEHYPNSKILLRVPIVIENINKIDATTEVLAKLARQYPNMQVQYDVMRPKKEISHAVHKAIRETKEYIKERGYEEIIGWRGCGDMLVADNTNIYPCPLLPRRNRKQFFGNAARDKNCIGTLRRGFFREKPQCKYCEGVK